MEMSITKIKCPVCGRTEFAYSNSYEICPVCEWENCEFQFKHPDDDAGPNGTSLNVYKSEWERKSKVAI